MPSPVRPYPARPNPGEGYDHGSVVASGRSFRAWRPNLASASKPDPGQTAWGCQGRVLSNRKLQQTRLHATLAFGPRAFGPRAFEPRAFGPLAFGPRAFESRAWRGCRNGRTLALGCANGDPCSL